MRRVLIATIALLNVSVAFGQNIQQAQQIQQAEDAQQARLALQAQQAQWTQLALQAQQAQQANMFSSQAALAAFRAKRQARLGGKAALSAQYVLPGQPVLPGQMVLPGMVVPAGQAVLNGQMFQTGQSQVRGQGLPPGVSLPPGVTIPPGLRLPQNQQLLQMLLQNLQQSNSAPAVAPPASAWYQLNMISGTQGPWYSGQPVAQGPWFDVKTADSFALKRRKRELQQSMTQGLKMLVSHHRTVGAMYPDLQGSSGTSALFDTNLAASSARSLGFNAGSPAKANLPLSPRTMWLLAKVKHKAKETQNAPTWFEKYQVKQRLSQATSGSDISSALVAIGGVGAIGGMAGMGGIGGANGLLGGAESLGSIAQAFMHPGSMGLLGAGIQSTSMGGGMMSQLSSSMMMKMMQGRSPMQMRSLRSAAGTAYQGRLQQAWRNPYHHGGQLSGRLAGMGQGTHLGSRAGY